MSQFLEHIPETSAVTIRTILFEEQRLNDFLEASSIESLLNVAPYRDNKNGLILLYNDVTTIINPTDNICAYLNLLQVLAPKIPSRQLAIGPNLLVKTPELFYRTVGLRHLIRNYFDSDVNEITDHQIYSDALKLVEDFYALSKLDKEFFLYNEYETSSDCSFRHSETLIYLFNYLFAEIYLQLR